MGAQLGGRPHRAVLGTDGETETLGPCASNGEWVVRPPWRGSSRRSPAIAEEIQVGEARGPDHTAPIRERRSSLPRSGAASSRRRGGCPRASASAGPAKRRRTGPSPGHRGAELEVGKWVRLMAARGRSESRDEERGSALRLPATASRSGCGHSNRARCEDRRGSGVQPRAPWPCGASRVSANPRALPARCLAAAYSEGDRTHSCGAPRRRVVGVLGRLCCGGGASASQHTPPVTVLCSDSRAAVRSRMSRCDPVESGPAARSGGARVPRWKPGPVHPSSRRARLR